MGNKSDVVTLQPSAAQTTAGQSKVFDLSGYVDGVVYVNVSAQTALSALSVFLQQSPDGTNFFGAAAGVAGGVPFFGGITLAAFTAPQLLAFPVGRSIGNPTSGVPVLGYQSRVAWTMTGTSVTFSAIGSFRAF